MIRVENDKILDEDLTKSAEVWQRFTNQTFFVTGATGLVGSMIVRSLLYANDLYGCANKVIAVVRDERKVKSVYGNTILCKYFSYEVHDLDKPIQTDEHIDYIIHCASPTVSKYFVSNPVETIYSSVFGTYNVLKLAALKKVKTVIYLSSMEMYGNVLDKERLTEEKLGVIDVLNIRSCYSEGKRMCECLCSSFLSEYKVPVRIARLAQTFGAGVYSDDNRVFAQFAKCVINNCDIILHTDGMSFGNYCYLSDVVRGIAFILDKGTNGEAYNVVNEKTTIRICDMAKMVCESIADNRISVVYDIPKDNLQYGYAPSTQLKLSGEKLMSLGWIPTFDLEEMYQRTILSFRERNIH